jgi:hypothetical protein
MAKVQLLVKEPFEDYAFGARIVDAKEIERVTRDYPDYVLREKLVADSEPTKAEVKAEGLPAETQARVDTGLPAGPLPAADEAKPRVTKNVALKG